MKPMRIEREGCMSPLVIAISGVKNSGKTTLLVHLLPLLRERGLKVAVLKHDGHEFIPDRPGTDSDRFRRAGAQGVGVYSKSQYLVYKQKESSPEELLSFFSDADLVLLKGGKFGNYPKIELVRRGISSESVCDPTTLVALCTNTGLRLSGIPTLDLDDYPSIAEMILAFKNGGGNDALGVGEPPKTDEEGEKTALEREFPPLPHRAGGGSQRGNAVQ